VQALQFGKIDPMAVQAEPENEQLDQKARDNDAPAGIAQRRFFNASRGGHRKQGLSVRRHLLFELPLVTSVARAAATAAIA
jgi:hypothetical protein